MRRILLAVALATAAAGAGAQVTFSGGTDQLITGLYNPTGTTSVQTGGKRDPMLSTSAGLLTATFLGFEALDTDTFLTMASGTLTNKTAIPDVSSLSGIVPAGPLGFTFGDLFAGNSVSNGGGGGGSGLF